MLFDIALNYDGIIMKKQRGQNIDLIRPQLANFCEFVILSQKIW